jgi:DNA polymerase III epsilon subunit-like protein
MREVMRFTRGCPLVAHNAAFDRGFWQAEAVRAGCEPTRRMPSPARAAVAPAVPAGAQPPLGTLAAWHRLPDAGRAHRALADAEVTAHLLLRMQADLRRRVAPTPLRCSVSRPVAELTSLPAVAAFGQRRRVRRRCALRARPRALRFSAPQRRAFARPGAPLLNRWWRADGREPVVDFAAGAARGGRFLWRREAQRRGRRA